MRTSGRRQHQPHQLIEVISGIDLRSLKRHVQIPQNLHHSLPAR
jgi:hypothetical protein